MIILIVTLLILVDKLKMKTWFIKRSSLLVLYFKVFIISWSVIIVNFTFKVDYIIAFKNFFISILFFSLLTFSYFLIFANKSERKNILSIYRIYYSIVVIMSVMLYSTYKDGIVFYSDYYKNKINYDLKTTGVDTAFSKYNDFFQKNISIFEESEIKNNNGKKIKNKNTIFFINIAATVIVLVTLFSIVWFVYSINVIKKLKIKSKQSYSIRKKINQSS